MFNRPLASIKLGTDKSDITFRFQDGASQRFYVEGDCCSTSWIEHLELPGPIEGAVILSMNDSAPVTQDHDAHDKDYGQECISVYNTVFATNKGEIILEYRNASNGYYGGYLVDPAGGWSPPTDEHP